MFKREDVWVGIVSVLLGIFVLILSAAFHEDTALDIAGPGGLPTILAWSILAIGVIHIVGAYYAPKSKEDSKAKLAKEFEAAKPILRIALVCVLYILLLEYIGYLIATPLLMMGIMWTINVRDKKSLLLTSVVTTIILYLIFNVALKVKLPMGFFHDLF